MSSPETSTRTTDAHRSYREERDRAAARTLAQCPPVRYEPYLDGLFTYCLSVLCDHDAATAALGDALALAERRGRRGPGEPADRRAWLYALARWSCLRKSAEAGHGRHAARAAVRTRGAHADGHVDGRADGRADGRVGDRSGGWSADRSGGWSSDRPGGRSGDRPGDRPGGRPGDPPAAEEDRRRRELALLAWPEAAGTTPEQREALELAVRHQLAAHEVAAVLGLAPVAARQLLAAAAGEVERTRAALAVVETGTCPGVTRITGGSRLVLGTALRRELVRHVDDCPRCRRTAERAVPGSWPGTSVTPAALPVLEAPRAVLHAAMTHPAHPSRARGGGPRFDRRGFPVDPEDHAARRDRLRARAVTTTVVATVVAAPVLALWAAYRGAPVIGEGADGRPVTASGAHGSEGLGGEGPGYENAGNVSTPPDSGPSARSGAPAVSTGVTGVAAGQRTSGLSVAAASSGDTTLVTLTADGGVPVRWSASTGAAWLYLSRSSGTLGPGESVTIKVYVDHLREPAGAWRARVSVAPAGAVVVIDGYGAAGPSAPEAGPEPGPGPGSSPGPRPEPTVPSDPGPSGPGPDPEPTPGGPGPSEPGPGPTPEPTPSGAGPSDPGARSSGPARS
ncbi:BACON domain-containing protein [Streptomyces beigongshangae]|uniref:BACON domain-containing protein n=1 Tax=Streptomyces beigongshangae TaxID=2841597 RepID=UPI001C85CBCB|nr:hypothetical protein [Streptomyces sp. REN17]